MFGRSLTLFTLFGFAIRVHASWLALAALILWSLGVGYFPAVAPMLPAESHWLMAVVGLVGLMACLVAHELAHSLVARWYGLPVGGVTLFVFGGIAELDVEPKTPRTEALMAAAGPVMSAVLAILSYGAASMVGGAVAVVLAYLGVINSMLAAFNLIPAFPMDGGRILRAALWAWTGDVRWATRMAALSGMVLGLVVMAAGVWQMVQGGVAAGMWWMLIGAFIRIAAAQASIAGASVGERPHS